MILEVILLPEVTTSVVIYTSVHCWNTYSLWHFDIAVKTTFTIHCCIASFQPGMQEENMYIQHELYTKLQTYHAIAK